jgi:hypothetical protein
MTPFIIPDRATDLHPAPVSEMFRGSSILDQKRRDASARRQHLHAPTRWARRSRSFVAFFLSVVSLAGAVACEPDGKKSSALASGQLAELVKASAEDVRELRAGMPLGAAELDKLLPEGGLVDIDPMVARETLNKARSRVQDLRVAKATFFALVAPSGIVVRSDGDQDRLVGKDAFAAFPALKAALAGGYTETRGSLPEAAGVRGRPDAQRVVAVPIGQGEKVRGLYVSGWSWAAYAYRLENAARSSARAATDKGRKMPLIYAYVIVGPDVFGAPISPDVNLKAIKDLDLAHKVQTGAPFTTELELTGRVFGLAAVRAPALGEGAVIALLRSET